jgi:two-component system, NarL family, invasion response regulator UvrY
MTDTKKNELKILIVDDSVLLAKRIQSLFDEMENVCVMGYSLDVRNALFEITNKVPDVVLIDVQLPNQEGIDLLRYIRNNYPHMVTIMLTSMADQEYNDICLKLGAHFYLDKTMGLENLQPFIGKIQKLVQ